MKTRSLPTHLRTFVANRLCVRVIALWLLGIALAFCSDRSSTRAAEPVPTPKSVFVRYCGECHTQGASEGGLDLDALLSDSDPHTKLTQWVAVWKNLRAQLMPPTDQPQPTPEEKQLLQAWIEQVAFQLDPANPDPGRVTIRRLNRVEYRYTIRDMLGVEFNTEEAFPADDTGYGFDTIGDVLSLSPLLVEKYLEAARVITDKAVPTTPPQPPTITVYPDNFRNPENEKQNARSVPIGDRVSFVRRQWMEHPGPYSCRLEFRLNGGNPQSSQQGLLTIRLEDREVHRQTLTSELSGDRSATVQLEFPRGHNHIAIELSQVEPPGKEEAGLTFEMRKFSLHGPTDGSVVEYPPGYDRIFFRGPPPVGQSERRDYAREILQRFAERAFRRPVDPETIDRLGTLAAVFDQQDEPQGFEKGIAEAMTAILASPRFLFRAEVQPEPDSQGRVVPLDEFSLASRLSFFLWSSTPDDELLSLARSGQLRAQLRSQVDRLMADPKSQRFVENFVGQWLRTRDVETMNIDARRILGLRSNDEARLLFSRNLRRSMREETELLFTHILRENRPVLELLTADYTFLNQVLANWYGIEGVKGNELQKVDLPPDSHRRGILTHASFLMVTSNPTRTSPVKRGLFILDNLLGAPAPPPPPDVPELEQVRERGKKLSMRELMEIHRAEPLCASCHARMDPLGLALEEYDALGRWRKDDGGQAIDTAGQLITGEKFASVRELSGVLATDRQRDFYACLTEKVLTYALGRGVEYYDAPAVDKIIQDLENDAGLMKSLIYGIVESVPFQRRRGEGNG